MAIMTNTQTLIVDLFPTQGSSVTAAVSVYSCILRNKFDPICVHVEQLGALFAGSSNSLGHQPHHKRNRARMDLYISWLPCCTDLANGVGGAEVRSCVAGETDSERSKSQELNYFGCKMLDSSMNQMPTLT